VRRRGVGAFVCVAVVGEAQCWGESSTLASTVDVRHVTMPRLVHMNEI
jgi:hypothetical protein